MKWRITLAFGNLLLAVSLFGLAAYRYGKSVGSRSSTGFYDSCCQDLRMTENTISYALNAPALLISAPARYWLATPLMSRDTVAIAYGDVCYFVVVFFFWWWVGNQMDRRNIIRGYGLSRPVGVAFSAALACFGLLGLVRHPMIGLIVPLACMIWGAGLLSYFLRMRRTGTRSSSPNRPIL
jgi:hypothetical protein